ncbi:MAG: ATP-dependent protease [Deltaproteobacteria bacterium RBG_13_43_22]|nr:MAG: ATP-dependent protease [Deltaproteobacteria bacterium RBG_13_43_22]
METRFRELTPEELRRSCDPESLGFETTAELMVGPNKVISQERAVRAILFGVGMDGLEYNIYVAGPPKAGMTYITRTLIEEIARDKTPPPDWCYVHNFKEPDCPKALSLPSGKGKELKKDVEEMIGDLQEDIPELFESEDYAQRKEELLKKFNSERTEILAVLEEKTLKEGFILNVSQVGIVIMPAKDGQPMDEETLKSLNEEDKKQLREKSELFQVEMNQVVRTIKTKEKDLRKKIKDLDRRIALFAVGHLIDELQEKYQEFPQVLKHFKNIKDDIIRNIDDFKAKPAVAGTFPISPVEPSLTRYAINVLVDNSETRGAPVVFENNPTYPNLFGMIEKKAQFGALFTDFTMIRPGSIHRANGGFLIIKVLDLLRWYFSWEGLKRSLKTKQVLIEDLGEQLGLISTKTLKPEPIPLQIKVLLIGEPYIYHLLFMLDQDFPKMFKVKAQLDDQMDRQEAPLKEYIHYIARYCSERGLFPLHKSGVARLIEYSSELTGRNFKLSLQLAEINDLIQEAHYWSTQDRSRLIMAEHIEKAVEEKIFRSNLYEEKLQEMIALGDLRIETDGSVIGQVNGLSVYSIGDYQFGRPSRITANCSLGKDGVVDIDRESKLSGNIHTKGVMILSGYLKGKYGLDKPLSLSASITFEQSYGMVDGDSASGAELMALLSSLVQLPVFQGIAVTGSVSQKGEIQPIGGVNEKIEGFFEVCREKGLTGKQGVMIPEANVKDLMLKSKVVEAVRKGQFHVFPISHIEQGLEILTGKKAGKKKKDGFYPKNSINFQIESRLRKLNEIVQEAMVKEVDKKQPNEFK